MARSYRSSRMRPARRSTDPSRTPSAPDPTRRRLTAREREVALLVADGLKDAVIARRLGLAATTTGHYIRRILQRLQLKDRRELAAWVAARRSSDDAGRRLRRVQSGT